MDLEKVTVDELYSLHSKGQFAEIAKTIRNSAKERRESIEANKAPDREMMSVESIKDFLKKELGWEVDHEDLLILQKITVQQGFVVDWDILETADHAEIGVKYVNVGGGVSVWDCKQVIPRPVTTRQMTNKEMINELRVHGKFSMDILAERLANGEKLPDLCKAAGIDTVVSKC